MNDASLYKCSNYVQRFDAKQILDEFSGIFHDNQDISLLDIGCGSGDVTIDFILPMLSENYNKLIGTDVSEKMIQHAKKTYSNIDKVCFETLDISMPHLNEKFRNKFTHVTSFYCLHWIDDQQTAINNIYDALHSTGHCLLVFLQSNPAFDVYKKLSTIPKWSKYMNDVDKFIPKLHYSKNAMAEVTDLFKNAGFADYKIDIRELLYKYEGTENLKRNNKAINPFVQRIPTNEQDEFMNDYIKVVRDMDLAELNSTCTDYIYNTMYKLVIAYGHKRTQKYKNCFDTSEFFQNSYIKNIKNFPNFKNDNKI